MSLHRSASKVTGCRLDDVCSFPGRKLTFATSHSVLAEGISSWSMNLTAHPYPCAKVKNAWNLTCWSTWASPNGAVCGFEITLRFILVQVCLKFVKWNRSCVVNTCKTRGLSDKTLVQDISIRLLGCNTAWHCTPEDQHWHLLCYLNFKPFYKMGAQREWRELQNLEVNSWLDLA